MRTEQEAYFERRARRIITRHETQNYSTVRRMRSTWHNRTLLGNVSLWRLIQQLAHTVDYTDVMLRTTNQLTHVMQVYEGMLLDGIGRLGPASANWDFERKLLFLALVHDVGKLLSLFGEDDANVDGMNTRVLHGGRSGHERGLGMDAGVVSQWNHDEFGYQKLMPHVPADVAWVVRWHSCVPLISGKLHHVLTPQEKSWLPLLLMLFEYDHKTKSWNRLPEVEQAGARRIVEGFVPGKMDF